MPNESCCANFVKIKLTNRDLCMWLIYFLREVFELAFIIVMVLQYLFNTSTRKENCKNNNISYNVHRTSQQTWTFGDQPSCTSTKQITQHRLKSINMAGGRYQTEKASPTLYSSSGMECFYHLCTMNGETQHFYLFKRALSRVLLILLISLL